MKRIAILPFLAGIVLGVDQKSSFSEPENYKVYEGLFGQDLSGNVFIIRYNGRLAACMSRHQFEGEIVPSKAETLDRKIVLLDPGRVFKQTDVQIIPLRNPDIKLPFLDFSPDFELKTKEKLWIERGNENQGTTGTLNSLGLKKGSYLPSDGPKELSMDLDSAADVRGASGIPVIQLSTGRPIGVLIAADDGERARRVVFEPICLPDPSGLAAKRMQERNEKITSASGVAGGRLFGVTDANLTESSMEAFSSMIPPEILSLSFGTPQADVEKVFPDAESVTYIEFPSDHLFHSADLLFEDDLLAGIRTHIVKTPSKEELERLMKGIVSTLGPPSIVMTSAPEIREKNHGILFRWNRDDGIFVLFFYTGIGGFYGKFWFCSKLIDENQIWNLKQYTETIDPGSYVTHWRDWIELVIDQK